MFKRASDLKIPFFMSSPQGQKAHEFSSIAVNLSSRKISTSI
jgi:hypothetical protein